MNFSHQQNNSILHNNSNINKINHNNSITKNRSNSNSYVDKIRNNIHSNLSLQPSNSLLKPNYSDRMNFFNPNQNQNIPYTPTYSQNYNMTPVSFNSSNNESGFYLTENIHVFLRIRPLSNLEVKRGDSKCLELANQKMLFFNSKNISRNFSFDTIFGENSSQEEVFQNSQIKVFYI